ncbi:hypothetical protein H0H93_004625, partial [Arthromyces matolae]
MGSRRSRISKLNNSNHATSSTPHLHKTLPLLPIEIYLTIISFATSVPQAFDTSFEGIQEEEKRDRLIELMFDCTSTRASLSSVSKGFHSIMENLLYEIIVITHLETIPKILPVLQRVPPGRQQPRGHTCRRLDIHIRIRLNQPSDYLDEGWDVGRNTLWGLLSACPNLQVLAARNKYVMHEYNLDNSPSPHLGHNALGKTISTYCARTLRRLELSGFDITMDRVELMLRYMQNLEACSISDCRPFNNIDDEYERSYSCQFFCDVPREYDENELEQIFGLIYDYTQREEAFAKFRKGTRLIKSKTFSDQMVKGFYNARDRAKWPPFQGSSPYQLPKLHSFHLDQLTDRIFEFDFPALKSLSTVKAMHTYILFNTNAVPDVQDAASTEMISDVESERPSKYDIHPIYCHYRDDESYYTNPVPHSTPFGIFPSTITHLAMAFNVNLARTLYFFPNITDLTWYLESVHTFEDGTPYWKPHTQLQHITIRDHDWTTYVSGATRRLIPAVIDAVKDGWLVNLSRLVLALHEPKVPALLFEECHRLEVDLTVVQAGELHDRYQDELYTEVDHV